MKFWIGVFTALLILSSVLGCGRDNWGDEPQHYVYNRDNKVTMQCIDVNKDRLKVKAGTDEETKKAEKKSSVSSYTEGYYGD